MMNKTNVLFLLFICSLFMQCEHPSAGTEDIATVVPKYDLSAGNHRTYTTKIYNNNGVVTTSYTTYMKVLRESTIVGEQWMLLSESSESNSSRVTKVAREQPEGYYERTTVDVPTAGIRDTAVLVYKYPAPANTKFFVNPHYDVDAHILYSDTTTIISRNIRVTVPAGTFNCYWYQTVHNVSSRDSAGNASLFPLYYLDEFLSDSGLVKMEGYSLLPGGPKLAASLELTAFTVH